MCGLFAGVGKLNSNRIVTLGCLNEDRGSDSVGIAYVSGKEVRIAKVAERPCVGLNLTLRKEVTEAAVSSMFIGHTRAATQGAVTSKNAHPFLMEGIAFAHNGIILNDDEFGEYAVDSQSLIHGIKAKDFSKYEGPIALVWIEDGKLNAFRSGNPLFRGRQGTATSLSSEREQLQSIGCSHIKELAEGMIYTFRNAFDIATKRVPRNKPFAYSLSHEAIAPMSALQSYSPSPSGWKLDAPMMPDNDKSFRTWKDERDNSSSLDRCEMCRLPRDDEEHEYCRDCNDWLKNELNADIPTSVKA